MKKILSLLLALSLLFALIGCKPAGDLNAPLQPELQVQTTEATENVPETSWLVEWPTESATEQTEAVPENTQPPREEELVDSRPHPADVEEQNRQQDQAEENGGQPVQTPTQPAQESDQPQQEPDRPQQQPDDARPSTPAATEPVTPESTPSQSPTEPSVETPTEAPTEAPTTQPTTESSYPIDPDGWYRDKDSVALYIHTFGRLPGNYISKTQGDRQYGDYHNIPRNMSIGGDVFKNRERLLPSGYTYYECDIGTYGGSNRGAKRLVFTTTGIVYYTSDHYESFTRLY